ncbi:hypothetical protein ACT3UT_16155 [Bacillus spizizenii ATCC 6633 = JCM 2499]|uniref:Uncharacterized protein n=1 Tax=Bacillus spizizenii (strain ATCC 23059 / NRRL B-14472 / W23) TaxID=655816 RepID=E0U3Z2_BACSH|nr:hypothetical protein [Bacillus spizizenii]QCJ16785.1 hypothetical protein FA024_06365 [Bacillus subtilis]ADM37564.1 hypothetical protein BSUW23_07580 [Bacillus spizizenii str. W23]AJW86929.1 hypothetical protein BIS30_18185 [Bacillus spizizenii]EFG92565.1 hypothetical protein BSU6633_08091 [Bacillus spizizenii ATCC 6633 = JCM 2499]KFK79511.1 hypothetical protein DJ97_3184 [Bacillus spizizenii]
MNHKEKESVFLDLYDLYKEGELEDESMEWMKQHEPLYQKNAERLKSEVYLKRSPGAEEKSQIRHMKVYMSSMYICFILLAIWMTVWFYF